MNSSILGKCTWLPNETSIDRSAVKWGQPMAAAKFCLAVRRGTARSLPERCLDAATNSGEAPAWMSADRPPHRPCPAEWPWGGLLRERRGSSTPESSLKICNSTLLPRPQQSSPHLSSLGLHAAPCMASPRICLVQQWFILYE